MQAIKPDPYPKGKQCCTNCAYAGPQQCRRNAPTRDSEGWAVWPVVVHPFMTWCGEWHPENTEMSDEDAL